MYPNMKIDSTFNSISGFVKKIDTRQNWSLLLTLKNVCFEGLLIENLEPIFFTFALYSIN